MYCDLLSSTKDTPRSSTNSATQLNSPLPPTQQSPAQDPLHSPKSVVQPVLRQSTARRRATQCPTKQPLHGRQRRVFTDSPTRRSRSLSLRHSLSTLLRNARPCRLFVRPSTHRVQKREKEEPRSRNYSTEFENVAGKGGAHDALRCSWACSWKSAVVAGCVTPSTRYRRREKQSSASPPLQSTDRDTSVRAQMPRLRPFHTSLASTKRESKKKTLASQR
jgi:hypothetical protein